MSNPTTTVTPPAVPADSVCVLCGTGTTDILGGQNFQTYTPNGALKAATKLENIHKENNVKLAAILAKTTANTASQDFSVLSDEEKEFLKEYGDKPKPESLEIRIIESMSFSKLFVPRNTPKQVTPLTQAQKDEKIAQAKARLEALLAAETVG